MQLVDPSRVKGLREALQRLFDLAIKLQHRPLGIGLIHTNPFDPHPGQVGNKFALKPVYPLQRMTLGVRSGDLLLLYGPERIGAEHVATSVVPDVAAIARQAPEVLHLNATSTRPTKLFAEPVEQGFVVLAGEPPPFQAVGECIGAVIFVDQYVVDLNVFEGSAWPDMVATAMEQIEAEIEADRAKPSAGSLREG